MQRAVINPHSSHMPASGVPRLSTSPKALTPAHFWLRKWKPHISIQEEHRWKRTGTLKRTPLVSQSHESFLVYLHLTSAQIMSERRGPFPFPPGPRQTGRGFNTTAPGGNTVSVEAIRSPARVYPSHRRPSPVRVSETEEATLRLSRRLTRLLWPISG